MLIELCYYHATWLYYCHTPVVMLLPYRIYYAITPMLHVPSFLGQCHAISFISIHMVSLLLLYLLGHCHTIFVMPCLLCHYHAIPSRPLPCLPLVTLYCFSQDMILISLYLVKTGPTCFDSLPYKHKLQRVISSSLRFQSEEIRSALYFYLYRISLV